MASPIGDGHEIVGPGDGGTQGDGEDVDERVGTLSLRNYLRTQGQAAP